MVTRSQVLAVQHTASPKCLTIVCRVRRYTTEQVSQAMYEHSHKWYISSNNDRHVVLYSTIDRSRVGDEDKSMAQPGAVRKVRTVRRTREPALRCADQRRQEYRTHQGSMQRRSGPSADQGRGSKDRAGAPVLRDQIYPVKVDNASRVAVLNQEGKVLPGAAEVLAKKMRSVLPELCGLAG
jgi:hypothetical protein